MVCYIDNRREQDMQNKKVNLKKVNKTNNSTVRTLDCHCGCEGRVGQAFKKGYVGSFI